MIKFNAKVSAPVNFNTKENDPVNHPKHYTDHPSGIQCIQITEHMGFCLGNAIKYIWRADLKNNATEDLKKAIWYIEREIARRVPCCADGDDVDCEQGRKCPRNCK